MAPGLDGDADMRPHTLLRAVAGAVTLLIVTGAAWQMVQAAQRVTAGVNEHPYPRIANIYWQTAFDPAPTIEALARWQVLVLNPIWTPAQLAQVRALNPTVKIFFMVNLYSMPQPGTTADPWHIENIDYALQNDLWWYDTNSAIASDWPDTWMVNVTPWSATPAQGHWLQFFAGQVVELIDSHPDLDGIFFDNFWKQISWQQGWRQLDSDCNPTHRPQACDGVADSNEDLDTMWNAALRSFAADLHARFDSLETSRARPLAILTNNSADYFESLNGTMHEYFPSGHGGIDYGNSYGYNWWQEMFQYPGGYLVSPFNTSPYVVKVLNAEARVVNNDLSRHVQTANFERHKRFCLVSALLGDGYLSLDAGHLGHGSLWWEPEYDHAGRGTGYLGMPLGPPQRLLQATGSHVLGDPGFDAIDSPWKAAPFDAVGTYTLDTTEFVSAPSAARIDISAAPGPSAFKIWQPGIDLESNVTYTLRFRARADQGQVLRLWLSSPDCPDPRCLFEHAYALPLQWTLFETSFTSFATTQASLDMFLDSIGTVWLDDFEIREGDTRLFRRDFDNGIVLLNVTSETRIIDFEQTYHRLGIPMSDVFDGQAINSETLAASDGRILLREPPDNWPPPDDDPSDAIDLGTQTMLLPVHPNPFTTGTRISFSVARTSPTQVTVHDVRGRLVRMLLDETVHSGQTRHIIWDGRDNRGVSVIPGTYLVRLHAGEWIRSQKVLLAR